MFEMCVCVCVLKRSYLFGSTSRRLCGHHHTVICLVSRTGLKLTSVNPIFVSGMTKCLSSGICCWLDDNNWYGESEGVFNGKLQSRLMQAYF